MSELSNPFPGLRPFDEREEHLFFGRESQVDTMVDKLGASHFLAVVGPSGSGKSSLVNCGLRPALHRGSLAEAGTSWRIARFRPGSDPLKSMVQALAEKGLLFGDFPASVSVEEVIDTHLRMSKRGLIELFKKARLPEHTNLLIIADQFEELFRYGKVGASADERAHNEVARAFVNLLLEPHADLSQRIYVVLTMRSDFLGDCAAFEGLPEAINRGQYLVPRMTRDERRAAIEGPIHVAGAEIEPVLLTRLVNDVGDNPDQLSILQHALNRTWAKWSEDAEGAIGLEDYEGIGTMARALDTHANDAYAELKGAEQRQLASRIFKALTDKGSDVRGIRRPTRFAELCAIVDATPEDIKSVIEVFRHPSRSFLMPPAPDEIDDDTVIDISHESLMRIWKLLEQWSSEEAVDADKYRRLAQNAELFGRDEVDPMGGAELKGTREWWDNVNPNMAWARRYHEGYDAAKQFLVASEENHAKKQFKKRLWAGGMGASAIIALIAVGFAFVQLAATVEQTNETAAEKARRENLAAAVQQFSEAARIEWEEEARYRGDAAVPERLQFIKSKASAAAAFAAVVAADGMAVPIESVRPDDLFDFKSIQITDSSARDLDGSLKPDIDRMFGALSPELSDAILKQGEDFKGRDQLREGASFLFYDEVGQGCQECFVQWTLQEPVKLRSVHLFAIHDWRDGEANLSRAFNNFKLFVGPDGEEIEVANFSPALPYGGNAHPESDRGTRSALSVCLNVQADGQEFRAEFRQVGIYGVRIVELDGSSEPCEKLEPAEIEEVFQTWLKHAPYNPAFQNDQ